jgi:hypothetical protein
MYRIINPFSIFIVLLFSFGCSEKYHSKKISIPDFKIATSKTAFDPASLKIICDSLYFTTITSGGKIQKLIISNGNHPFDTILIATKKLKAGAENEIIKADYTFDGFCEFIIPDRNTNKSDAFKHYYYVYDPEKKGYFENTTLPAYIGDFKLDIKNQRLKLYCPGQDCFAYFKYTVDKKFELVQGEFNSID